MNRSKRSTVIGIGLAVVCAVALVAAGGLWVVRLKTAAYDGKAEAESGVKRLAVQDTTGAAYAFAAATGDFSQASALLGPRWLGNMVSVVPVVGRQYVAARALAAIGADGSSAGTQLTALLQEAHPASEAASATVTLATLLTTGRTHVDSALASLQDAADQAAVLDDKNLAPPLSRAVRSVKSTLGAAAPLMSKAGQLLVLERYLLSAEHRILVVSQDSAELRPTGGFAGSYGVIDIGPNGLKLEEYKDVYALPDAPGRVTPPQGARMSNDFSFRDANWWLDFPTSARSMLGFWRAAGQPAVDGIVAVDVVTVRDLLKASGPIHVPSYSETFTSENLLDRLLYLVEVKSASLPNRKGVLTALADELEKRMLNAGPVELSRAALAVAKSAESKHVQIYFQDAEAQAAVTRLGWSGSMTPPQGTTDVLAVSNAMTKASKANIATKKSIDYEVVLAPGGSAEATLVLGYANTAPFKLPAILGVFRDYVRAYGAKGTVLTSGSSSLDGAAAQAGDIGLPLVAREFSLTRGQSHRESISTRVPGAWLAGRQTTVPGQPNAVGTAATSGAHYRLFIVRQADLQEVPTNVTIAPPEGWRVSTASAWMPASGRVLHTSADSARARLATPLSGDVIFDVGLTRD